MGISSGMNSANIKVLLIEDDPGDVGIVREMLTGDTAEGFQIEHCERLSTGIERLIKGNIDVVLLDLNLPDCQGLETFKKLHIKEPTMPVVVISGLDDDAAALEAVQRGAQDYLIKGQVSSRLISHSIRYAIERRCLETQC